MNIGEKIIEYRDKLNLNDTDLCKRLDISLDEYYQYIDGIKIPSDHLLKKMSSLFNVPYDELLQYVHKNKKNIIKSNLLKYIYNTIFIIIVIYVALICLPIVKVTALNVDDLFNIGTKSSFMTAVELLTRSNNLFGILSIFTAFANVVFIVFAKRHQDNL